ncbi:peptidylprolyl isomerase [Actinobacillus seminis]|uniref:Peptidyl-prolyl cis-trans isomerase n=1 Tax=Actinobacillus seminis TaxID=722 RepID=A0A263HAR0_9PAST|nr:FKBP-type peptidyl-prolyl cis-trans isomerase [Actinobacillus seminis]OZN24201.1 peptidylprolyl isomerase [Actinobacillus seminis]SUU38733.1 FKBP-type peptidylprolyl isomerase [Actinobacillus seminis]
MLKIQKLSIVALALSAVVSGQVFAAGNDGKQFAEDASYAVGVSFGAYLKSSLDAQKDVINYDNAKVLAGVSDALGGKIDFNDKAQMEKLEASLTAVDAKIKAAAEVKMAELSKKVKAEGEKFQSDFAKKEGVKKTASGLFYRIEKMGSGKAIKSTDLVKVHYTGKLPDGTVFDSSVERGQPAEFKLDQVVPGWTEGLQLVKKGGKIELVLPPQLAYGEQGSGPIPPNATLYFDVEVLDATPEKTAK